MFQVTLIYTNGMEVIDIEAKDTYDAVDQAVKTLKAKRRAKGISHTITSITVRKVQS